MSNTVVKVKKIVLLSAALVTVAVTTGCGQGAQVSTPTAITQQQRHSGEDLFRGLVFGQGVVAQQLPEVWEASEVKAVQAKIDPAEQAKAIDQVVEAVKAEDATFLARFATEMQSGNPVRVRQAMDETVTLMNAVASKQSMKGDSVQPQCSVATVCAAVAVVVGYTFGFVYSYGAVAVAAVAVAVSKYFWPKSDGSIEAMSTTSLERDRIAAQLATRLKAAY